LIGQKTKLVPVSGGEYIEGVVGQPIFINPILVGSNDPDRDLVKLLFSDLIALADNYKASGKGKVWNVRLKDNIFWHDGQSITSDDVIFTVKTIQDSDSRSPLFSMWQGVTIDRVSEREIKITLPAPYAFFETTLKELRPIPKHIFEPVPAANLRLSDYNLEPIGSGPFKFSAIKKERSGFVSEEQLVRSENYFDKKPYLDGMTLKFYQNEDDLLGAFNSGAISGFGGLNQKNLSKINISHQIFKLRMPRYYAIFFNPYNNSSLKDKSVRLALNYAVDKKSLIDKVFGGQAIPVYGPLLPGIEGYDAGVYPENNFSLEKANQLLDSNGWLIGGDGVREKTIDKKESQRLEFTLIIPEIPFLEEAAEIIKNDWGRAGIKLNLSIRSLNDTNNDVIKTRNYEMVFFGNIFRNSESPDLSSFWHSSERFYPGLNLALYENKTVDNLLMAVRENLNNTTRQADLSGIQSAIINDSPAVFLFSPPYFYAARKSLGGPEENFISLPSDRFDEIQNWYVKTARVFK
jgi:peptide/nickel transport system substrate-binding protein